MLSEDEDDDRNVLITYLFKMMASLALVCLCTIACVVAQIAFSFVLIGASKLK